MALPIDAREVSGVAWMLADSLRVSKRRAPSTNGDVTL
jgi:hypothetical protein